MTDHAAAAVKLLDRALHVDLDASALMLTEANVHAFLAIAHEQRAANLIAAATLRPDSDSVDRAVSEYLNTTTQTGGAA